MNTSETESALLGAVLEDLEDVTPRLVLADLYEEQGDLVGASCWRWFAKNKSRPSKIYNGNKPYFWNTLNYVNYWKDRNALPSETHIPLSGIPARWLVKIPRLTNYPVNKYFASEREAFLLAVEAWVSLTEQEREECEQWK